MRVVLVLDLVLLLASVPLLIGCAYLFLLTLCSGRREPPIADKVERKFSVVVPAHNESAGIAATVQNLLQVDYPSALFDVVVVADNCVDDTAERATQAGATTLVRHDAELRGKGYALHYAFERLSADRDAVVVVDADTLVSPNLLRAFAARLDAGAQAIQADYAVRNPSASWRTLLMAVALGCFHIVRSRARERLGVSCGLRGNGMCFTRRVLDEVPHQAYSIVEDVEYGLRLASAGHRVHYADEAHVYGEMVSSGAAAGSQRQRWEDGRRQLIREHALPLLKTAFREQNGVLLDLAADLLLPPLAKLGVLVALGFAASFALMLVSDGVPYSFPVYSSCLAALVIYILRGWMLSGTGAKGLLALGFSPVYAAWKVGLRLRRKAPPSAWVRTERERS
jgi:1,2-diacylglycerol 3-beta-glucosyltransferase